MSGVPWGETRLVQGNEAVALGALAAGIDFFAGYPITPSTEVAEILAREMPLTGGKWIQMEDEIASVSAIIGASLAGARVMTATSGPGFSLMQEGLGYACMTEVPIVIVDVMGRTFDGSSHPGEPGRCDAGPLGDPRRPSGNRPRALLGG